MSMVPPFALTKVDAIQNPNPDPGMAAWWRRLRIPGAAFIADLSYSLYLIHPMIEKAVSRFLAESPLWWRLAVFIVLTLGIGVLIINALLFLWVGRLVDGFYVANFWAALWGAVIVSITNIVLNSLLRTSASKPGGPPAKSKRDDVIDI